MDIPLDEVIYVGAITNSSSGVATDADSTPTFAVYEESTDTDIGVGGNMTKRTSLTGQYRASFTASAANGFELGKFYEAVMFSTVNGTASKTILKQFRIVAAETTAGYKMADVHAILAAATNMKKNAAFSSFMFVMTDSTAHAPATGLTVTAQRSIDGAAFASCANSVTEVANGVYKIDLANTDLNGNNIMLRFTATGADPRLLTLITQP